MKRTRILMGMHIAVEVADSDASEDVIGKVFSYFKYVDDKFSTYKKNSEITQINNGKLKKSEYSLDMKIIFRLAEKTKRETGGYFDILDRGRLDPSGIVKGWAIYNAAKILEENACQNFYIDAGGDIQTHGTNRQGKPWRVGIRNPFKIDEIVKVVTASGEGIATSGTYERGEHVYNPKGELDKSVKSITVIGRNVLEADRYATAAFAMGKAGIKFIENLKGFGGYMIEADGMATMTSGFSKYMILQ
jgi:thiamine biosynthesis lipoprotein